MAAINSRDCIEVIGYGRVSTIDQSLDLQEEKLKEYGCEKIFMEKQSGAKSDREDGLVIGGVVILTAIFIFKKSKKQGS